MVNLVLEQGPVEQKEGSARRHARRPGERFALILLSLITGAGLAWGIWQELQTSYVESLVLARVTRPLTFEVGSGPSPRIRFPTSGPYDQRLGYTALPSFLASLGARHFVVQRQATLAPELDRFIEQGGYAVYHEKQQAGLTILDRGGEPIYRAAYPQRVYGGFESIPILVINTLLFIEDRDLLDARRPNLNPAIVWPRFLLAAGARIADLVDPRLKEGGASTLATQIVKFRHSPSGLTGSIQEKLRQMVVATARAYRDGPDTLTARRRIVTTYLDSTPLSSRPGYGEIIGLGDGLWAWYGTDLTTASRILSEPTRDSAALARKAGIYRQVLSLLLAQRRPSYYLIANRAALRTLTDRYLRLLGAAEIITPALEQAAHLATPQFRTSPPAPATVQFDRRKAVDDIRTNLLPLLHVSSLYTLDRLDLTVGTSIDAAAQQRVSAVLSRLDDPDHVRSLGLTGHQLLGAEDPARVNYSVILYERGADRNYVRLHADSLNEPFDINSGAKLILGSTAKLRTLITYLDIVAALYHRDRDLTPRALLAAAARARDPLTRWTATFLAQSPDSDLQAVLDAAMHRRYSANPNESFFTGGGVHVFHNFERSEDGTVPTVENAFEHSINLAFIRLMRDIVSYEIAATSQTENVLDDPRDPDRQDYLRRFADQEGRAYLSRFFDDYQGLSPDEALNLLASRTRPVARRLAMVFRSVRPTASFADFRMFLAARLPGLALGDAALEALYRDDAVDRYSLADRGYLAGDHPLELWLAGYLQTHPHASRPEILDASTAERQEVYGWLFKTHDRHKQDIRIRTMLEEDAFDRILQDWRRLGYPFGELVPSLATAIGSSGDRPDALAHLMGIVLNGGIEQPTVSIEQLHFAQGTPYETDLAAAPRRPVRVLAPEVAATVRRALLGVVADGTGTRAHDAFHAADGSPIAVGGKTGTGDNRFDQFGPGHRLIESRAVDRTATFAFFIGKRFFGTITAYVRGTEAAQYHFTSALAVQLLKALGPELEPLLRTAAPGEARPAEAGRPATL
jgi:membrane peptidoglycan carboxypeptidase